MRTSVQPSLLGSCSQFVKHHVEYEQYHIYGVRRGQKCNDRFVWRSRTFIVMARRSVHDAVVRELRALASSTVSLSWNLTTLASICAHY
ncbi:hypothetical protein CCR75_002293 [Bremia lactucae]|uniref:Uncharacterized protein n=1 Tax=Bremia lactucae TaxID=4779 RepID=A0A976FJH2_BRELC|nr:hypothetical protein CCR75_002293 [Bremia lactucae]